MSFRNLIDPAVATLSYTIIRLALGSTRRVLHGQIDLALFLIAGIVNNYNYNCGRTLTYLSTLKVGEAEVVF